MTIDSADDSKISNRTITTNRISNRTYDSKSNRITKLRRSLPKTERRKCHPTYTQKHAFLRRVKHQAGPALSQVYGPAIIGHARRQKIAS